MPLRCLDLCCGTKSVREGLVALYGESGVDYVGVDSNHRAQPEILADLATWDYRAELTPGEFDVVWASPPCTEYSTAKGGHPRNLELADSIASRCVEMILYLRPRVWFMENPLHGMLKSRPFMSVMRPFLHRTTYCHYGRDFKKPTAIWSNRPGLSPRFCCRATPCEHKMTSVIHPACSQRGPRRGFARTTTREEVYKIPPLLLQELLSGITSSQADHASGVPGMPGPSLTAREESEARREMS